MLGTDHAAHQMRYNTHNLCPVCQTGTKGCSRSANGIHFCRGEVPTRKGDIVNGFAYLGRDQNDEFSLFKPHGDGQRDGRPSRQHSPRSKPPPGPAIDWAERHQKSRERLTQERLDSLAEHLGIPGACLQHLEPGFEWAGPPEPLEGVFTLPMRDGAMRVCGLHTRCERTAAKKAAYGSRLGAFVPTGWREAEGPVLIPEGASSTAALTAMGIPAIGRASAKCGLQAVADLLDGTDRQVIVIGDFDPKPSGDWPGRDGAIAAARKIAAVTRREVSWSFPPDGAKDARAWYAAQGLTHLSLLDECHVAGERFLAGLQLQTVKPPEGGEEDPDLIQTEDDVPTLADARAAGADKRWIWEGWIQADVLAGISGEFGHGKTRFIAELIRRIRTGEPWPDGQPMTLPPDSRFLFVPADYQHSELCDLAEKYGFPEECIYINSMKDNPDGVSLFDSPQAVACLEKRIAVVRPTFVVIDPITGTTTGLSHCSAEDGTAIYGPLQRIARKSGVSFLILVHLNREGGTYGRHARGKFRQELKLAKVTEGDGERYRLEVTKSNSKPPPPLGAAQQDHRWDFDLSPPVTDTEAPGRRGKSGPKPQADAEAEAFLRTQLACGARLQCEVVREWEAAGHSTKTVFAAAKALQDRNELLVGEQPSPKGRKQLKTWSLVIPPGPDPRPDK